MPESQEMNLQAIEKKFNQIKNENNFVKANGVLSIIKSFFKSINDTDFQVVFKNQTHQLGLNDPQQLISLEQIKFIYLSIQKEFKKIKKHVPFGIFANQQFYTLRKSHLQTVSLPDTNKYPTFQIFQKELTQIIPYEIVFFDSLYKRQDRPSIKTPEKLTEQSAQQIYYCYDFKIYQSLLDNFQSPQMNKLVRFFYQVIDFRWIEAAHTLKQQIQTDDQIKQASYLIPVFQNLKHIQQQINKKPNILKPIIEKRKTMEYPTAESLQSQILKNKNQINNENSIKQIAKRIRQIRNLYDFACSYCASLYQMFKNPYIRAISYFLGTKFEVKPKFQEICNSQSLGVMMKFLFARRFLAPEYFKQYYQKFLIETKTNPKIEHIMFLKNKSQVVQTIQNYWDNNPGKIQEVALTCGVVLHKVGKGFNGQYKFLQQMLKIYEQLLRKLKYKQFHKQYMVKMMSVRSSKQPIWEDLIVKPQFRLHCQHRSDDCVFLSMLQKFLYGGQQKWNKLKSKTSMPNDQKRHYQVEAKQCPYCNYPTPRCSICLQQIKIFTVKSYLNQQIKRKQEKIDKNYKEQKPYMKLNQLVQQALIWCPSCGHGGHFGHLESWFKQGKVCPVDRCNCKCKY